MVRVALALVASLFVTSISQAAFLTGTTVLGSLTFSGGGPNYFDPNNLFVPAGFGNSTSPPDPSVMVSSAIEFGFQSASTLI